MWWSAFDIRATDSIAQRNALYSPLKLNTPNHSGLLIQIPQILQGDNKRAA